MNHTFYWEIIYDFPYNIFFQYITWSWIGNHSGHWERQPSLDFLESKGHYVPLIQILISLKFVYNKIHTTKFKESMDSYLRPSRTSSFLFPFLLGVLLSSMVLGYSILVYQMDRDWTSVSIGQSMLVISDLYFHMSNYS